MLKRRWLAICTIGGGLAGLALGVVTGKILGGALGGLLLGGAIGLFVRGQSLPPRPESSRVARTIKRDETVEGGGG